MLKFHLYPDLGRIFKKSMVWWSKFLTVGFCETYIPILCRFVGALYCKGWCDCLHLRVSTLSLGLGYCCYTCKLTTRQLFFYTITGISEKVGTVFIYLITVIVLPVPCAGVSSFITFNVGNMRQLELKLQLPLFSGFTVVPFK